MQQEMIRGDVIVKALETEDRIDKRWAQEWCGERERGQKVSSV